MSPPRHVKIYLEPDLRRSAEAGQHNFIGLMAGVLERSGFSISYCDADAARLDDGYSLFHMAVPFSERSMTFRRVYYYPFWAIERSDQRWEWDVARATFDPATQPRREAVRFYDFWRNRLFGELAGDVTRGGFVYVPLQGRLLQRRSFQSCAPVEMMTVCAR